jgi:hypothetical protein
MIGPPDAVYSHLKQTSGRTSVGQEAQP